MEILRMVSLLDWHAKRGGGVFIRESLESKNAILYEYPLVRKVLRRFRSFPITGKHRSRGEQERTIVLENQDGKPYSGVGAGEGK